MGNSTKGFGFFVLLFGITLASVAVSFFQYSRVKNLTRVLTDQASKFEKESS